MNITTTELNRSPGKYVEVAEAGETVLITKRGKVVAMLVPGAVGELVSTEGSPEEHEHAKDLANVDAVGRTVKVVASTTELDPDVKASNTGHVHSEPEVDDWDMPVEPKPMDASAAYRAAVAKVAQNGPTSKRVAAGLSKSQQAGGKYQR